MSYCRFENTSADLEDCYDAIENDELENLSDYEVDGFLKLVDYCKRITSMYEDYDSRELQDFINSKSDNGCL